MGKSIVRKSSYELISLLVAFCLAFFLAKTAFGANLSTLPIKSNGDVVVPAGTTAVIDRSLTINGAIVVSGTLKCKTTGDYTLNIRGVIVKSGGLVQCGQSNDRVTGNILFHISKGRNVNVNMTMPDGSTMTHKLGQRVFVVLSGGKLEMYGKTNRAGYVQLKKTANAGDQVIRINAKKHWSVGDRIAIAPTDFDALETEHRQITKVTKYDTYTDLELNSPLNYTHFGKNQGYSSATKSWTLKSSAEVANLKRNIRIRTADAQWTDVNNANHFMGAHMMIMKGGSGKVDAVEFDLMGQAGHLGRYPFHWHMLGDASGQFIKNSSVHNTFQRCIVIHDTNKVKVGNNLCYFHRGHGIFMENGSEVDNEITGNLVMLSMLAYGGRHLLESEAVTTQNSGMNGRRWRAPSSYWIANPRNTVEDNISAGSQGTGFWMSFEATQRCNPSICTTPAYTAATSIARNRAKANLIGMTWDGARSTKSANNPRNSTDMIIQASKYYPPSIPVFRGNQTMKSSKACFYSRATTINLNGTVSSDCSWHHFHGFNTRVNDSIMIGKGPFPITHKNKRLLANEVGSGLFGMILYDGPFELRNVHFQNFSQVEEYYNDSRGRSQRITMSPFGKIGAAQKYVNRTESLSFSPEPYLRADFRPPLQGVSYKDTHVSNSILDKDGSLFGDPNKAGWVMVTKNDFNRAGLPCNNTNTWNRWNVVACDYSRYKFGIVKILDWGGTSDDLKTVYFNAIRNNQYPVHPSIYANADDQLHTKFNMLTDTNQVYKVDMDNQDIHDHEVLYLSERANESSNLIRITNTPSKGCYLASATRVYSEAELLSFNGDAAYFRQGIGGNRQDLVIRIKAKTPQADKYIGWYMAYSDARRIYCN